MSKCGGGMLLLTYPGTYTSVDTSPLNVAPRLSGYRFTGTFASKELTRRQTALAEATARLEQSGVLSTCAQTELSVPQLILSTSAHAARARQVRQAIVLRTDDNLVRRLGSGNIRCVHL